MSKEYYKKKIIDLRAKVAKEREDKKREIESAKDSLKRCK